MESSGLGRFLRQQRERRGWSGAAMAAKAGLSPSHYSQIERGKIAWPSAANRRALASALGVSHVRLLVEAGELAPDEAGAALMGPPPFAEGDPRAKVVDLLHHMDDEDAIRSLAVLTALTQDFRELPVP